MASHADFIKASPHYSKNEIIFADPSAKQSRIDLFSLYGVETFDAVNAVEDGIESVREHLKTYDNFSTGKKESWYYIMEGYFDGQDEGLKTTEAEFSLYKYPKGLDGKPIRRQPMKVWDHGMDATRYIVHSIYGVIEELVIPATEIVEEGGFWY